VVLRLPGPLASQTTDNQRRELEAVAARSGWEVVGIYEDAGISGAKGCDKRPGFDRLLKDATARKINMIATWSVDRLGRSLQDLVGFLNELQALGCNLYLHQQALDTTTPSGRAMFQMCGVFAEFERCMIRERVNAGLTRAKANGIKLGRAKRKDGRRSADEKRWGKSADQMEKRILGAVQVDRNQTTDAVDRVRKSEAAVPLLMEGQDLVHRKPREQPQRRWALIPARALRSAPRAAL
jgi:DNA invertase Pin-like site-specific DNA recombinase